MIDKLAKALNNVLNKADFDCGVGIGESNRGKLSYTDITRKVIRKAEKLLKKYNKLKADNEIIIQTMRDAQPTSSDFLEVEDFKELIYSIKENGDVRDTLLFKEISQKMGIY